MKLPNGPNKLDVFKVANDVANYLMGIGINRRALVVCHLPPLAIRVLESLCVSQITELLMRLLRAHLRKPASDTYLRDYLIGGVVWVKREECSGSLLSVQWLAQF